MKLVRTTRGPHPLKVPRLRAATNAAGDVVEIPDDLRHIGEELIAQGYFTEEAADPALETAPTEQQSGDGHGDGDESKTEEEKPQ
ncbi:MAG TPA: hypothetical protein VLC46_16425 [Thermoanaerobaculia bacterium]|jgi:hypothetical protein|nr:hypothetical protein [Thermoanaerobaculia bacterium]